MAENLCSPRVTDGGVSPGVCRCQAGSILLSAPRCTIIPLGFVYSHMSDAEALLVEDLEERNPGCGGNSGWSSAPILCEYLPPSGCTTEHFLL